MAKEKKTNKMMSFNMDEADKKKFAENCKRKGFKQGDVLNELVNQLDAGVIKIGNDADINIIFNLEGEEQKVRFAVDRREALASGEYFKTKQEAKQARELLENK